MSNQPAPQQQKPVQKLKQVVNMPSVQEQFKNAMGENTGLFTASLIDVYATDQTLQKCDPNSVVMEALKAATLKLPINRNLGFAYIVPYKGKATMQIGYKGYLQLAMRTGQYRVINTDVIYEGEIRGTDKLTGQIDLTGTKQSDTVVGYFAYIETVTGFRKLSYWTKEDIIRHAQKYSQSYNSKYSPWQSHFDEMAKKTVLKHLLSRYGVMSVDLANALQEDEEQRANVEAEELANQEYIDVEMSTPEPQEKTQEEVNQETEEVPEPEVVAPVEEPDF